VRELLAVVCAAAASSLYALSTSLQALEARAAPPEEALRSALLARLARRRTWLVGAAAGGLGWGLQAAALALASLALVQPALGLGLVVLLVFGVRLLSEPVGRREIGGAGAIAAAVAVLAWTAPRETGSFTRSGTWTIGGAFLVVVAAPALLRVLGRASGLATSVCAGTGWACVGTGTALVVAALADRRWAAAVAWGAAVAVATWSTLVAEMTSLQVWPATRAVPIAFALEMLLPAALAPLLTSASPRHAPLFAAALVVAGAGAALLGGSPSVADAISA
jgi:drug/metabolite transporter (DMT)-like permease